LNNEEYIQLASAKLEEIGHYIQDLALIENLNQRLLVIQARPSGGVKAIIAVYRQRAAAFL
jgi:hypothetical protein